MANRICHLTGFGGQPESWTGFQPLCCDVRTGRARGARVESHAGPNAHRFQRIRRLSEVLLLLHLVAIVSSAIAIEISAIELV